MSRARPRPLRDTKCQTRFVDAADRADFLDSLDWRIAQYQWMDSPLGRQVTRALVRRRRTLRGLVIGA